MDPRDQALIQPEELIQRSLVEFWPAIALALAGTLFFVCVFLARNRLSERALSRIWHLAPLTHTWPIYAWGVLAALANIDIFDFMAVQGLSRPPLLSSWANVFREVIALALVLVFTSLSALLARIIWRRQQPAGLLFGPFATIAAISADWVFVLAMTTPMR